MSYIATSSENQPFEFETILRAPMLQTDILFKLDDKGNVDMVLKYKGVFVTDSQVDAEETDPAKSVITDGMEGKGVVQQVAKFDVVVSYGTEADPFGSWEMPLTESTLKTKFLFAPKVIPVVVAQ